MKTNQLGGGNLWGESYDNTSQTIIQQLILVIALLCVPMMLIPKPIIEIQQIKKHTVKKLAEPLKSSEDIMQ
jgi:inner membrane protein involved in colicin E2 resistance